MIHRALVLLRKYHGLKQKDLAEKLDRSPSYISEIESGTKVPTYDLLQSYSEVFDIPVSSIMIFAEASGTKGKAKAVQEHIAGKALQLLEWLDSVSRFQEDTLASKKKTSKASAADKGK